MNPERSNRTLMALALIMAVIPMAFCVFYVGGFYGLIAGALWFCGSAILGWFLRKRHSRRETGREIDQAMGTSRDDPRQIARWIP
jgi:hypothetical protein